MRWNFPPPVRSRGIRELTPEQLVKRIDEEIKRAPRADCRSIALRLKRAAIFYPKGGNLETTTEYICGRKSEVVPR